MSRREPHEVGVPPWLIVVVLFALALWIAFLTNFLGYAWGQTLAPVVHRTVLLRVTNDPHNSKKLILHITPVGVEPPRSADARGGPLYERLYHNGYEELRAQHNPMKVVVSKDWRGKPCKYPCRGKWIPNVKGSRQYLVQPWR